MAPPLAKLKVTLRSWGENQSLYRVIPRPTARWGGEAKFIPLNDAQGAIIPTLYAGSSLDCALMEAVFHDVPFVPGPNFTRRPNISLARPDHPSV
jgi:hypothetical protein